MKKAVLVLVILAVALLMVLTINTARFQSRQEVAQTTAAAAALPVIDRNRAAENLAGALRIQTISHAPESGLSSAAQFLELHQYLEKTFPQAHVKLKKEVVNQYSLLYTWAGSEASAPPILLMAHMDVVPVEPGTEGNWSQPPFAGVISGGYIWGRGAWDDKASVMGILEAVEALLGAGFEPRQTIYLAFGHDEEISGHQGAEAMAAMLEERGVRLEFVLDEGLAVTDGMMPGLTTPAAMIGTAEKGYLSLELLAEEESGHSSMPPRRTAIGVLSAAIARLEANPMPGGISGVAKEMFEHVGPEMPFTRRVVLSNLWLFAPLVERQLEAAPATNAMLRTTTAPTIFESGVKDNVLPLRARAVVNFRIRPGDTMQSVIAHARQTIADERIQINVLEGNEPSPESSVEARGFKLIARAAREVFPEAIVAPGLVVGATDSRYFRKVSDNTYRFLPVIIRPEDVARFHGANERIAVDNYAQCIAFYHRLITTGSGE